jgi:hypothetical protein
MSSKLSSGCFQGIKNMIQIIRRSWVGLATLAVISAAQAADPNISYSFTGPQASEYQFVDSGWRTIQGVTSYQTVEFGSAYEKVSQYTDNAGSLHEVTQTGFDMIGYQNTATFEQYSRSLGLSIAPTHQGRFELQFEVNAEIGGAFYAFGEIKPNLDFYDDLIAGLRTRPLEWSAQFQAPADSALHEVHDDFMRQMLQDSNLWELVVQPVKPGLNAFSLSLPATASFSAFSFNFIQSEVYGPTTRVEVDNNFLVTSTDDRVIVTAVPEPETWAQMAACLALLVGVGQMRRSKQGKWATSNT